MGCPFAEERSVTYGVSEGPHATFEKSTAKRNNVLSTHSARYRHLLILVLIVYGLLQGGSNQLFSMAFFYFWKDGLKIEPDQLQRYEVISSLPWDLKPLWGFMSDAFPPKSFYLSAGALGGVCCLAHLAWLASAGTSPSTALMTFMHANAMLSLVDVMMDAIVVEEARESPDAASAIYAWGSIAHFVCAGVAEGSIQDHFGCEGQFVATGIILCIVLVATLNPGYQQPRKSRSSDRGVGVSSRRLARALLLPCVYQPLLYTFLSGAIVPSFGAAYFYFLTEKSPSPLSASAEAASGVRDMLPNRTMSTAATAAQPSPPGF